MSPSSVKPQNISLRARWAARGIDRLTMLIAPAALFILAMFIYPFLYGLWLSLQPKGGPAFSPANYTHFFNDPFYSSTIWTTLRLALPATLLDLLLALPIALRVRHMKHQRLLTTILVIPITLGTVLIAQGLLNYLGPQGWVSRTLMGIGLIDSPVKLLHNYWGVFIAMVLAGFPFTFLLMLSYMSGIDPAIENAAATLGAGPWQRFRHVLLPLLAPGLAITFCLSFVQEFSVFPSAVLLGAPAGPTRTISIVAYQAAYEHHDFPLATAIAMIMAATLLCVVVTVLALRRLFYRGSVAAAKG